MLGDNHRVEDCPQAPTLKAHGDEMRRHGELLERLERHSERQTEALERIAEQGAMVKAHEKRLDLHEHEIDVIYTKHRALDSRVREIELKDAAETGAEEIVKEDKKFWNAAKIELLTPGLIGIFFILWMLDKFGVFMALARLFKEMRG